ncbi:MAG: hypothetical protein BWX70_03403 [Verrucomicrobia bacterium ADurb.Bin070]|nr:MAG: hypothetical protein BWX70_03403 [Verrucomicrobia bacterium ADurb.Bin070]
MRGGAVENEPAGIGDVGGDRAAVEADRPGAHGAARVHTDMIPGAVGGAHGQTAGKGVVGMIKPDGAGIQQLVDAAFARNQAAQVQAPCADFREQRHPLRNLDVIVEVAVGPPVEPEPRRGGPVRHEAQRIAARRQDRVARRARREPHIIQPVEDERRGDVLHGRKARVVRHPDGRVAGTGRDAGRVPVIGAAPVIVRAAAVPCVDGSRRACRQQPHDRQEKHQPVLHVLHRHTPFFRTPRAVKQKNTRLHIILGNMLK